MDSEPSTVRLCFFGLCKGGRSFKTKGVDVERDLPFISGLAVWPLFYDFCTKALLLLFVPLAGRLLASYLFLSLFFWSTWERRAKDFRISGSWTCQYRFWSRLLPDAGHFPPVHRWAPPFNPKVCWLWFTPDCRRTMSDSCRHRRWFMFVLWEQRE